MDTKNTMTKPLPLIANSSTYIYYFGWDQFSHCVFKEVSTNQTENIMKTTKTNRKISDWCWFYVFVYVFHFGDNFVKFGILHFIALGSLPTLPILDKPHVIYGISIVILTICGLKRLRLHSIPDPLALYLD